MRIGVVKELGGEGYQAGVLARFQESVDLMVAAGAELVEVSCPSFVHALATYYLILPAEASSNLARFDAMRYGLRSTPRASRRPSAEEVMRATREAGFGDEVKRRIILGTYALSSGYYDAYYGQAQKVRTLISQDFAEAFTHADVLLSPTAPTTAFKLGEKVDDPLAMYLNDLATIPANLSGVPGISVPSGLADEDGLPGGRPDPGAGDAGRPGLPRRVRPSRRRCSRSGAARCSTRPAGLEGASRMSRIASLMSYDEALERFDPALGLEVHVELNTTSKMFCGCPTEFGAEPNTQTCPTCLGLPGSMPVVNAMAVESAIRIGLALNCEIAEWCRFARKNYFYPDMPKNFQTSQYDEPIAFEGWTDVVVEGPDGPQTVRVDIERAHMEEDTGKSLHVGGATGRIHGADYSLVDYNRAGIPLIEIVTKPILGTREMVPAVAKAYVAQLRDLLLGLGVSDVRMEQGSLRCDVNLSLAPRDTGEERTTVTPARPRDPHRDQERQLAAFGRAGGALRGAAARRRARPPAGRSCRRPGTGTRTPASPRRGARSPTPRTTATSPSPTWCRWRRTGSGWSGCGPRCRSRRTSGGPGSRRPGASPTSRCATPSAPAPSGWSSRPSRPAPPPAAARKWWLSELARRANETETDIAALGVTPGRRRRACRRWSTRARINDKLARQVFDGLVAGEGTPDEIVAARGLAIVSDDGALSAAVDNAIAANPDVADKIRDGKVAAAGALIGAVMKEMRGQADAGRVRELILEKLT